MEFSSYNQKNIFKNLLIFKFIINKCRTWVKVWFRSFNGRLNALIFLSFDKKLMRLKLSLKFQFWKLAYLPHFPPFLIIVIFVYLSSKNVPPPFIHDLLFQKNCNIVFVVTDFSIKSGVNRIRYSWCYVIL